MSVRVNRRKFLQSTAAAAGAAAFPMPAVAQNAPLKIGLMTVKTGPLAAGGVHIEEGFAAYLKSRNSRLGGRAVDPRFLPPLTLAPAAILRGRSFHCHIGQKSRTHRFKPDLDSAEVRNCVPRIRQNKFVRHAVEDDPAVT